MTSTLTPTTPATSHRPTATRRLGYTIAVLLNVIMLWVAHQLLDWQWPGFLTADYERLLPIVTVSFVASIVVNVAFLVRDRGWFRALGDLTTAAIGLVVAVRTWTVFPFDFASYESDWSWLARLALVAAIGGTGIAIIVNLVKLVRNDESGA